MATGTFLDGINEWNAKSAVVIKDLVLRGDFETASLLSSLRTTANDDSLSQEVRLNALTALINRGELLDIPVPPYYPVAFSFTPTQTYVGLHNDLSGLNSGDYWHLTYAQYLSVLNKASIADITFANLTGDVDDSTALFDAFNLKQDVISAGSSGQFFGWDGAMRFVSWTNLTNKPTTLAGLGISAADTLFDGRYVSQSSIVTSYTLGSNAAVLNTDSLVEAIGKLQAQLNSVTSSAGTISSVGLTIAPTIFSVANSPLTGAGGTINVTLQSQAAKTFLASPNAGSGTPSFRQIVVADLPTSGVSAGTYGNTTNWPTFTVDSYGRITSIANQAATSGGTVTSVGLSAPVELVVSNSPVTTTGTLGLSWQTQTANYVLAGPPSGVAAAPSFRALVAADIPTIEISQVNTLQATLDALSDSSLGVLATDAIYIGNGSDAAVASVVSGDLAGAYLNDAGTNKAVFTIQSQAVTFSKFQNITSGKLLGRYTATTGSMQEISLDPLAFTLNASTGVLGLATPNPALLTASGDLLTSNGTTQVKLTVGANATFLIADSAQTKGIKWAALSGDATIAVSGALTIAAGAVTLAKMANLPANTIIGNNTASSAVPLALSKADVTAMINTFTSTLSGAVPATGAAGATDFLNALGNWVPVTGTGTVTSVSVVNANGFNGSVATSTSTPAITISTTVTGILKGNGTAMSAATAGTDIVTPGQITQTSGAGSGLTMASGSLLGNTSGSLGPIQAITVNSTLSLASSVLGIDLGNTNIWTVLQQFPSIRLNGSTSGFVSFTPPAVAGTQAYTLPSAVPTAGTTRFLTSTDGGVLSWQIPAGSGTTTNAATFNNSGSGAASGTTFDGSVARTISYNTLGAQQASTNLTGLSALTYASGTPFVKMTAAGTFSLDTNTYISGTATQYALLVGGAANSIASITPVVSNKLLISNGTSANPGWTDASYLATTTQYGILYSSATNVVSEILPPGTSGLFLQWTGSGYTWAAGGGGGGSGTVSTGTIGQLAYYTGTTTVGSFSAANSIIYNNNTNIAAALPFGTEANKYLRVNGSGTGLVWDTAGTVTSVGLTMPSAFNVSIPTITTSGIFAVTGAGTISQYVRGDGTLAPFPTAGGGGSSLSYYLNGSVASSVVGYEQMNRVPVIGLVGTDYTLSGTSGLIAQFITDVNDPSLLNIPAGAWDINFYFRASNNTGSPTFYVQLLKYDGTTFTPIATGLTELIDLGTTIHLYTTSISVPSTPLTVTDRLVIKVFGDTNGAGRNIIFHTEGPHLAQIITTFTTGLTALNGLTEQVQFFANGTAGNAPAWTSSTATHTLNIPLASSANTVTAGLISYAEYTGKLTNPLAATGDIIYSSGGTTAAALGIGTLNQVLSVSAGGLPEWKTIAGGGNVVGPGSSGIGNFAVYADASGTLLANPSVATLSPTGAAVFNSSVTVGVSGTTQGQLVLRNLSGFTTTLQSSDGSTGSAVYTFPLAQATSAGLVLTNDGAGNLSWTATGTGNVTLAGTNAFTGANSFASTVGFSNQVTINGNSAGGTFRLQNPSSSGFTQLVSGAGVGVTRVFTFPDIATATVAVSNVGQTFTGVQQFNGGLTVNSNGLGAAAVLRIQATGAAGYTTIATANNTDTTITLPLGAGTLAFQNVGQTFSGNQSFSTGIVTINGNGSSGSFRIQTPTTTGFTRFLSTAGNGAAIDMTFPSTGGTIPILGLAQNWSQLQTFQAGLTVSAGLTSLAAGLTVSAGATTLSATGGPAVPQLSFSGGTMNWINFSTAGIAAPTAVTRSGGTRFVFSQTVGANALDYAIGLGGSEVWLSAATTAASIAFYVGTATNVALRLGGFTANGLTLDAAGLAATPQLNFNGSGRNWINFSTNGVDSPTNGAAPAGRSSGTRIVFSQTVSASSFDYAIGQGASEIWFSVAGTSATFGFWAGTSRIAFFGGGAGVGLTFGDAQNIVFNTTTGTKIATATGQKLSFWNKTPIVQPTTAITGAAFVQVNTTTAVSTASTFGGYTLDKVVAALINTGILA